MLYKLGFTTMSSVEARLGYAGQGHEALIEEVLLFQHFRDAYDLEQAIHGLCAKHAVYSKFHPEAHAPLSGNGQSELYAIDILGLDPAFTPAQAQHAKLLRTRRRKAQWRLQRFSSSSGSRLQDVMAAIFLLALLPFFAVLFAMGWATDWLQRDAALEGNAARLKAMDERRLADIVQRIHCARRG